MAHLYSYFPFSNNDALQNNVVPNFSNNTNNKLSFDENQKWPNNSNNNNNSTNNVNKFGFEEPKWKTNNNSNGNFNEDQQWNMVATKLAIHDQMRAKFDQTRNLAHPVNNLKSGGGGAGAGYGGNLAKPKQAASKSGGKHGKSHGKSSSASTQNDVVESMINKVLNLDLRQKGATDPSQKGLLAQPNIQSPGVQNSPTTDKRFKTLPPSESLPRNETLGGYIFVCNNDTMQEDLKRQLFGLPQRYRDSVRAIQPGLPLFLYNYTTHQLHGIFEAVSFGGSNIDPTAWEDKKNKGESRFPAQVRIRVRKMCRPLEEDAFRPVLYHYDGPKFRLMLSIPETLALMDLLSENGAP